MNDVKNDAFIYLLGALTLALGFAWNQAITSAIEKYFPIQDAVSVKFIYAIALTIFIVLLGRYVFGKKPKDKFKHAFKELENDF